MRTVFFILACIIGWCYGLALAGTEREARIKMLMQRHPNSIFLPMPEAMVTEEKTGRKAEGPCISGYEEHVPFLYWEQQDMLRIDFPEGCRYQTEYKLEFPADLRFLRQLRQASPEEAHAAFLQWMRGQRDSSGLYSTWQSGWKLIALHEFLKKHPIQEQPAVFRLSNGSERSADYSICRVNTETLQVLTGAVYATIQARASGAPATEAIATDRGLSISRLYEKQTKDGGWKKTDTFVVGDIIRVSLVCTSREERELNYLALEDYLPACMEAINLAIPNQAAGLQALPPGQYFDHREYHADRVWGFCTRVSGHNHVNMTYYARVKRAGRSTAPPAKAELMYEPGICGLSNSSTIISQ